MYAPLVLLLALLSTVMASGEATYVAPDPAVPDEAHAGVRLTYEAPPSCPGREAVVSAIAAQLGYDPVVEDARREVSLRVTVEDGAHRGALVIDDATRVFTSESCGSVVASAAVAAAIAIDPATSFGGRPRHPVQPAPPPPSPQRLSLDEAPAKDADGGSSPTLQAEVYAAPFLDVGVAPGLGGGALAGAAVRVGFLSFGLEGRLGAPRGVQVGEGAFVDVLVAGGAGLVCGVGATGPLLLSACGEALFVDYVVTGRGLDDARTDHALLAAVGPRLSASLPLWPPLTLGAFVDVLGVPLGVRVRETGGEELFTSSPLQAAAGLRVGAMW